MEEDVVDVRIYQVGSLLKMRAFHNKHVEQLWIYLQQVQPMY